MATNRPGPSAGRPQEERSHREARDQNDSSEVEMIGGHYRKLDQIGKGSFATVYKGVHPDGGNLIAIKTIRHTQLKGKLRANLFSEIEIMRKITHPHIVGLVDILETTHHIHLIMEFCQLGDLATFVKKRDKLAGHPVTADMLRRYPNPVGGGFNEVIVRHFAKQLASALQFLRSKNLVHRDLKPQNLLLNPPHNWIKREHPENRPYAVGKNSLIPAAGLHSLPFLKIADFGFARHLPTTTMAETLCGSPLYMAPEILRYEKYDAKADLWSVGTVLYELMVGKPPFRAANHVDLLRRIERAMDQIAFPRDLGISQEMETVIRGLLRKMPTERLSWDNFFKSAIIIDDIPGLVESDKAGEGSASEDRNLPAARKPTPEATARERRPSTASRRPSLRTSEEQSSADQPRFSTPPESTSSFPRRPSMTQNRPLLPDRATAPSAVPGVRNDRIPPAKSERRRSIQPPSPGTSAPREPAIPEKAAQQRHAERAAQEERERAAQDVAFERDYVMVEKRAVEVNAFADELAASPHVQSGARGPPSNQAAMARRATTQAVPSAGKQSQPTNTNRAMQLALRPDSAQQRRASYDQRLATGKTSAQSALAAALNMVNLRFVNNPFAPASGKNPSPPQGYGPFPAFPAQPSAPLLIGGLPKEKGQMDEDHRVLSTMEDSATRSDVVYGFAEVKYKQLIPIAPSNDNALRGREEPQDDDDGLTPDAIVSISEEALVLYLKALAILTNTINLAGSWWSHKARHRDMTNADQTFTPSSTRPASDGVINNNSGKPTSFPAVGARINGVVQWSRNRFNECLEKSEFVSRKLTDAQCRLPSSHEQSPSPSKASPVDKAVQNEGTKEGGISFRSGITAEKLMWERALDMSRSAAVNELVLEDLPGCEVSYLTALRLLEAVLERDSDEEQLGKKNDGKKQRRERQQSDGAEKETTSRDEEQVSAEDRETVTKLIEQMQKRLSDLRKKLAMQKANQRHGSTDREKKNDKNDEKQKEREKEARRRAGASNSPRAAMGAAMARAGSSPGKAPLGMSPR
ncbi:MAG: hypothetical protein Q9159_006829 [Coniocarpon cinnabarinum]